jgi:beta-glucosidase
MTTGFLWGAATSAIQVEGGSWNTDAWVGSHLPPFIEPIGDACDHYHRYSEDIRLLAGLGLNAFRFTIDWSRVEPEDGEFSFAALAHYARVIEACEANGIVPVVTLYHIALPRWVADAGGVLWDEFAGRFERFAGVAMAKLGSRLSWVGTLNEPDLHAFIGFRLGLMGPVPDPAGLQAVANSHYADAHRRARDVIKAANPSTKVGMHLGVMEWGSHPGGESNVKRVQEIWEGPYFDVAREGDDFVGVQSYTRLYVGADMSMWEGRAAGSFEPRGKPGDSRGMPIVGSAGREPDGAEPRGKLGDFPLFRPPDNARRTDMGYEFRPESLGWAVRHAATRTGLPVLVTEHGIATNDDPERIEFMDRGLASLTEAMHDGVDVRGYLHWSLLDNWEGVFGYKMRFGLVEVDRRTFERRVKPSALWLGERARAALAGAGSSAR